MRGTRTRRTGQPPTRVAVSGACSSITAMTSFTVRVGPQDDGTSESNRVDVIIIAIMVESRLKNSF
eukprot:scaffold5887_cov122-Cylindrotheca_fusiformis.AAC.11